MTYPEFIQEWRDHSETIVCQTSGSTGEPQKIKLPKSEVEKSALRTNRFFNLGKRAHFHSCISPDFIGGKMMAVRADRCEAKLTYERPSNRPLKDFNDNCIDLLAIVPSQMIYILDHRDEMPQIKNIIIGGAPIPPELRKRIAASGYNAWETYGMTETCSHIALRKIQHSRNGFTVLDGINISRSASGCLNISLNGWKTIETNDLVEIYSDGTFEILGRSDFMIITGGKKANPMQIEMELEAEFECEILVTSEPDEKWGERIIYIFEDFEKPVIDEDILAFSKKKFEPHCLPKEIRHMHIPRTANGKKSRRCKFLRCN